MELTSAKLKEQALNRENEIKKNAETEGTLVNLGSFNQVPVRHTNELGYIMLFLELVLKASISLRGTANSLEIISKVLDFKGPSPSWSCGSNWLLRSPSFPFVWDIINYSSLQTAVLILILNLWYNFC